MPKRILKPQHPTQQAVQAVFDKMEELGVNFHQDRFGNFHVTHEGQTFDLEDESGDALTDFPSPWSYNITYEKEEA